MSQKGFSSKAEFFRYLTHIYIDLEGDKEEKRFAALTEKLNRELAKYDNVPISSLEEQLADI